MAPLNTKSARVIDPVLTGIAQGYIHAQRVGSVIFPRVDVLQHGGKVIEFGRESFFDYKARRAPGANVQRIQFGYEGKPFALDSFALDAPIPREFMQDAETVPGVDLGKRAVNTLMDSLTLSLEIEQAALAADAGNYPAGNHLALSGADRWSDASSDPVRAIDDAKDQVRATCGIEPNRMVVGAKPFRALKNHPKIVERFKYTSAESITAKMLAGLFDLDELAVGKTTYVDDTGAGAAFKEAWGNVAALAYTPLQDPAIEQPSFGYTYTLKGHPFVEQAVWENGIRSWVHGVSYARKPVLTGIASGFLFTNVSE